MAKKNIKLYDNVSIFFNSDDEILVNKGYNKFVLKNEQDDGEKKNIETVLNKIKI